MVAIGEGYSGTMVRWIVTIGHSASSRVGYSRREINITVLEDCNSRRRIHSIFVFIIQQWVQHNVQPLRGPDYSVP